MDIRSHNRNAWNRCVDDGDRWTQPVSSDAVGEARDGKLEIVLTPTKRVPMNWFPELRGTSKDSYSEADKDPLSKYAASFIATRAIKP